MTKDEKKQVESAVAAIRSAHSHLLHSGRWFINTRSRANAFSMLYEAQIRLQTLLANS